MVLNKTEIDSPPFLRLMQPTRKEIYESMKLLLGKIKYDEFKWKISRLWHCYLECNSGTQNIALSCASGTAGTRRITM